MKLKLYICDGIIKTQFMTRLSSHIGKSSETLYIGDDLQLNTLTGRYTYLFGGGYCEFKPCVAYADSTSNAFFTDLPDNYSICVTKQGYIPYILEHRNYIQNETINNSMNIVSNNLRVGKSVTTEKPIGDVVFEDGIINIKGGSIKLEGGTTIKKGTSLRIYGQ